ncbi:endonuclease [Aureisphaera galaxeae]|uniref:endonuclease/exonuclease/phosphatase family protein n=1 Tax=Aureisphaera galaxeae TaxID=1538023 RepID=UPI0023507BD5|nr:endonuclease [Aureisphaera galaxeae]MDC8002599.1 endonuclease [Aureisphaera galaxeae]
MSKNSSKKDHRYSIAFYNLENLFDTTDDPNTLDDDFTPDSDKDWNEKRYRKKLKKMGRVISNIGYEDVGYPPAILGLAEMENAAVLRDLIDSKFLKKKGYDFVHFDSSDERGIDTALLYRKKIFEVIEANTYTVYLTNEFGERDYTRDILYVKGELEGQMLHLLVNHWPSRRKGTEETAHKRIAAAKKNLEILDEIYANDPEARIVIMGDFNDDPNSESIKTLVNGELYNPMEVLLTKYEGTLKHRENWHLFDQIIISHNFLKGHENPFRFKKASIFNPEELRERKGKYKGLPFRTYVGKKYLGGYSDHFPVYAIFDIH